MEKSPDQRFQSARDLAFHLEMLSSGSGTAPTLETKITERWNRSFLGVLGAIALLIAGFGGGWLLRSSRIIAPQKPLLRFTQVTHEEGLEMQPASSPDGDTFVFTRGGGGGSDIYLQRVNGRNAINLTKRCPMADLQPAFSPDGTMIAYRSECDGGGIFIMGATGEAARRITTSCFNPAWSPDSKKLACGSESVNYTPTSRGQLSELWMIDAQTGERKLLLAADGVQPSWSPHGHRIAYWGMDGESAQRDIWTIDPNAPDPSKTITRVTNDLAVDWNPVWSPDGQYLYFGSDRGGAMNVWRIRVDEESGTPRGEIEPSTVPARFAAHFSMGKQGTRMLYASIDQKESLRLVGFDPESGATVGEPRPVIGGTFLVFSAAISPNGRFVAVTNRGGQEDLFVVEVATGEIRQLTDDTARDRGVFWSPDGAKIYFYSQRDDNRYEIWSINADGSHLTRITRTEGRGLWYPTVSPDGKKLACYNDEHTFLLDLSLPDAKLEQMPATHQGSRPAFNAWSPDATMLAGELRGRPGVVLYTIADRTYRPITTSGVRPIWLPGGKEILYSDNGKLRIVHIETGAIRDVTTTLGIIGHSVTADARTMIYSDRDVEADVWMSEVATAN
jgi:Tol biopolymer transport system component